MILADGMGGHQKGELASQVAVDYCAQRLKEELGTLNQPERIEVLLEDCLQRANVKVYLASLESSDNNGMGTTLTIAVIFEDSVYIAHVGDSRAYLYRAASLERLTTDQTMVQAMISSGTLSEAESMTHPQRHVLSQALGAPEYLKPEILHLDLRKNDRLLLCSDGLHGYVDEFDIAEAMRTGLDPQRTAENLIQLALGRGGFDNVTVLTAFF